MRDSQQGIMTRRFSSTVSNALWLLPKIATKFSPAYAATAGQHPRRFLVYSQLIPTALVCADCLSYPLQVQHRIKEFAALSCYTLSCFQASYHIEISLRAKPDSDCIGYQCECPDCHTLLTELGKSQQLTERPRMTTSTLLQDKRVTPGVCSGIIASVC